MSKVSIKGQVTLPAGLRKEFGITAKTQVTFDRNERGILVRVVPDFFSFKGRLKSGKKYSLEEMRELGIKALIKHRETH